MLEHLLQWIGHFDPIRELNSLITGCLELFSVGSHRSDWLLTQFKALIGLDTWTFYVGDNNGWRGLEIEQLLAHHGIQITSRGFANGDIFFNIKLSQAEWAEYLMLRAGVPIKYGLHSAKNERYRSQTRVK